jgi:hypothetical protein
MLNFTQHILNEMAALSSDVSSDDKGKLHELLLAKHLHPNRQLPQHHRSESDEYGGTPEQVHNRLQSKVSIGAYNEIDSHAKQTADKVREYMKNNGYDGHKITDLHWTSNRDTVKKGGDHEKTTGIRDPNANADLILTTKHPKTGAKEFLGVSAKYGTEEQPNYRNDGLAALEKKGHLKPGTLTDIQKAHDQDMTDRLKYNGTKEERHETYKIGRNKQAEELKAFKEKGGKAKDYVPKHKEAVRARQAEDASVEARTKMARHLDAGFATMNDHEIRNFIRGQVSPPTKIHHIVAHSHVQDDGSAVSKVGDMSRMADKHLDNFTNIRVKPGNGISTQFVGDFNGKTRPVAQQILKTGSGPVKGSAGAFKLISIPKKLQKASTETPIASKSAGPKKIAKSFVQHVAPAPSAPVKKKKVSTAKPFAHPVSKDVPGSVWADKEPSGEYAGAKFKSKSEME